MKKIRSCRYLCSIVVLMVGVIFMGASCSSTSANVSNAVMTTNVDENYMAMDEVTSYPLNSNLYVAAELHNAPDDTEITFIWYANGEKIEQLTIGNDGLSDAPLAGYLPKELVTVPGKYAVEIYIDDREEPDTVNEFMVE